MLDVYVIYQNCNYQKFNNVIKVVPANLGEVILSLQGGEDVFIPGDSKMEVYFKKWKYILAYI